MYVLFPRVLGCCHVPGARRKMHTGVILTDELFLKYKTTKLFSTLKPLADINHIFSAGDLIHMFKYLLGFYDTLVLLPKEN